MLHRPTKVSKESVPDMPSWDEIVKKYSKQNDLDEIRKTYLQALSKYTGRNVIAYYSSWLQQQATAKHSIQDNDKNALMAVVHKMDASKGVDIILHTPGGDIAATESLVAYLRTIFGTDVRAIVPQISMSAGTMMACACKEIIMGKQSNLGPIDPQFGGLPCQGVIEEFQRAVADAQVNPASIPMWQTIINKYHPTFIGECEKAIQWADEIVREWLKTGMFLGEADAEEKSASIVNVLKDHGQHKTHSRHITAQECIDMGLKVSMMEDDQKLQDAILSVHHSFMLSLSQSSMAVKIVENQMGKRMVFNNNQQP